MLGKATLLVLFWFVLKSFLSYRDWLNWQTSSMLKVAPGPCDIVMKSGGSECLTHIGNGKILLTSGFDLFDSNGSMKIIDLKEDNKITTLKIVNAPEGQNPLPSPHGMSVWRDSDTGQLLVYVLTHTALEDRVMVFEILPSMLELKYIKYIRDPSFVYMNDLVVVDRDQFYITSYWMYRTKWLITLEIFTRLHFGKIFYFDGHKARVVASEFCMPNGLNLSPDKQLVYMAECGDKKLWGYKRRPNGDLEKVWEHQLDSCVDNIEVDPDSGDLWIGTHPLFWRIVDVYNTFDHTAASQVLRVKMRDNAIDTIEQIYADNGAEMTGTTSATYVDGKLVIGTVAAQTAVCDVKYLST